MNMRMSRMLLVVCAVLGGFPVVAADLSDLVNPDDIMLRRPAQKVATPAPAQPKVEPAPASAQSVAPAPDVSARKDLERELDRKTADIEAKAALDRKAAEQAAVAARKAAEEKAKAEEELKRLREQIAAEQAARVKAETEKAAAEQAKAEAVKAQTTAEQAKAEAVKAQAAAEAEKKDAEAVLGDAVQQIRDEREARARAEAGQAAAEAKAAEEKKVAVQALEKAQAAKADAEKRAAYLANPDPDERPQPKKLVAEGGPADVTTILPGRSEEQRKAAKRALTGRAAVITADRTDYDRKEGVILFDRNVYVDDEQYQMHADRMFVFLDGTNDLKRLVALGNVAITNDEKTATCARAVYTKKNGRIVMYANDQQLACLTDAGGKPGDRSSVTGQLITYWIESGMAEVKGTVVTLPGLKGSNNPKEFLNLNSGKDKDK